MQILVIEDDKAIGKALVQGFTEAGHECHWQRDGERGLAEAQNQQADVIVLDLRLPGLDGLEVLHRLRGAGNRTPVIVLTALGSVEERVKGLDEGADDYVVKPFAFAELMARIDAVCRRTSKPPSRTLGVGELSIDLTTRRVYRQKREIELTPTELSMLEILMRHSGQVVTRKMLCEYLWDSDWEGTTNVIDVHINRLRKKLDRGCDQSIIQTVRGRGYALRIG